MQGAAAFVCRNQSCSLPVTTPQALVDLVNQRATPEIGDVSESRDAQP